MAARGRAVFTVLGWLLAGVSAHAACGSPVVVIPGRPDVPVIVNPYGFDASYTVVEGDFGLDRPAQINPTIIAGPRVLPSPVVSADYFPRTGSQPGYGRYEIKPSPNRRLPAPAPTYYRGWGAASDPLPASTDPPYPINVQPFVGWGGGRFHRHRQR